MFKISYDILRSEFDECEDIAMASDLEVLASLLIGDIVLSDFEQDIRFIDEGILYTLYNLSECHFYSKKLGVSETFQALECDASLTISSNSKVVNLISGSSRMSTMRIDTEEFERSLSKFYRSTMLSVDQFRPGLSKSVRFQKLFRFSDALLSIDVGS